jgi:heme exporter protein A
LAARLSENQIYWHMITHPAIRLIVNQLAAMRGTRIIFQGLDLRVECGHALTVVGPNGAGKTTLLRCIAGFLPATHGTVTLAGGDDERGLGEQCHYIGHTNGIKPALTVSANLRFFANFLGGEPGGTALAAERLALAELEDIPAAYLSAGQKRRLGRARLICARRPLWLLDEPAVSLEEASQRILAGMVAEHLSGGGIVVAATHTALGWDGAGILDLGAIVSKHAGDAA